MFLPLAGVLRRTPPQKTQHQLRLRHQGQDIKKRAPIARHSCAKRPIPRGILQFSYLASFFLLVLEPAHYYHAARSPDRPCRQAECRQKLDTEQSHRCVLKSRCVTSPTRDYRTRSFWREYSKYYTAADVKVFRQLPVCNISSDHAITAESRRAIPTNQVNATSSDSQR